MSKRRLERRTAATASISTSAPGMTSSASTVDRDLAKRIWSRVEEFVPRMLMIFTIIDGKALPLADAPRVT